MRARQKAIDSYGEVNVVSGVNSADNIQLIQMLFDGLVESLKAAEGQIKRGEISAKAKSLARASKIVLGLQNALDFDEGGEIASNLNELYSYVVRRLFHVNAHNDIDALLEIHGLMEEIRQAWKSVPSLISPKKEANASGKSESITN
jgi:flagellar protein FliS|tara:strand:+ start:261 stop:701 length:441 start_codon:yes stop_codon:yes gene_type:complete